jgi:energy-coupling factor transporter ATP-binding protein EcfA2
MHNHDSSPPEGIPVGTHLSSVVPVDSPPAGFGNPQIEIPSEDDTRLMPEWLATKFDALPTTITRTRVFSRPVEGNHVGRIALCVSTLQHNGFTLDEAIELMRYFPHGFGALSIHAFREAWRDRAAEQANRQAECLAREQLLNRTSARTLLHRQLPQEECLLGSVVTKTCRTFIVGATGTGKTNLALAMAGGIVSRQGFLHWRSSRKARVLYVDGEMALPLLQQRISDLARRLGGEEEIELLHYVSWQEPPPLEGEKFGSLNTVEGQSYLLKLCEQIQPDVVFFDNVQSLVAGDMRDEVPWNDTMPLVLALTARGIGQLWFDHTGHNTSRQYGASRKAWPFDTVAVITALPDTRERGELAFALSFDPPGGKTRNRTPANWDDYAPRIIRLRDDQWTVEEIEAGNSPSTNDRREAKQPEPETRKYYDALINALAITNTPGETTMKAWTGECERMGLTDPTHPNDNRLERERQRGKFRKHRSALVTLGWIGCDGERVFDCRGTSLRTETGAL